MNAPLNRWRVRMIQLLELIAAAETEGDRDAMWEQFEIARLNAEMVDAEAEMALRLTADAEAEIARLTTDGESS